MNNIERYDALIEKFLSDQMSEEEAASFKNKINSDPELKEHATAISALIMGMKRKHQKEDNNIISDVKELSCQTCAQPASKAEDETGIIENEEEQIAASTDTKGRTSIIKMIALPLSIAAMAIIVFNIFILNAPEKNEVFDRYYSEYSRSSLIRGDENIETASQLEALFNNIGKNEDCSLTIDSLETIYKGVEANYEYRPYVNDIAWYLALAYIKDNQTDKAIKVLEQLIKNNPDTEIAERCKDILKDLKDKQ